MAILGVIFGHFWVIFGHFGVTNGFFGVKIDVKWVLKGVKIELRMNKVFKLDKCIYKKKKKKKKKL
jgi:hypothetical protein